MNQTLLWAGTKSEAFPSSEMATQRELHCRLFFTGKVYFYPKRVFFLLGMYYNLCQDFISLVRLAFFVLCPILLRRDKVLFLVVTRAGGGGKFSSGGDTCSGKN